MYQLYVVVIVTCQGSLWLITSILAYGTPGTSLCKTLFEPQPVKLSTRNVVSIRFVM